MNCENIFPTQYTLSGMTGLCFYINSVDMSFTINSVVCDFSELKKIRDILFELPIYEHKYTPWLLEKIANNIAKSSMRSKGNVIIYSNPKLIQEFNPIGANWIYYYGLDPNEIIMTYIGPNEFDAGLIKMMNLDLSIKMKKEERTNWVKHEKFNDYFQRVKITGNFNLTN